MLTHLYIRNFTLIDELDMEFGPGFSVITGETGAGKSIVLGAIALLLGQRADMKTIKAGADKCVVEARFDLSAYEGMARFFDQHDLDADLPDTIVRRELTASGKSRAFVNDVPVSLALLKELGERLIDVHSQHQNLLLQRHDFQLNVLDTLAAHGTLLAAYADAYQTLHQAQQQLDNLCRQLEADRQTQDFMQFQWNELYQAALTPGEQEELEARSDTMSHAEEIKQSLYAAHQALQGGEAASVLTQLRQATQQLHQVQRVFAQAGELTERLDAAYIELKDVAQEVEQRLESVDFDPQELDAVNDRLDRLYSLQQKYHTDTVAALIDLRNELRLKLDAIEGSDESQQRLLEAVESHRRQCQQLASQLTAHRRQAASQVEQQMLKHLVALGMPHARFTIEVSQGELTPSGADRVAFLFSANTSSPMQPVAQVASGGEIARVMLALKAMVSGAVKLPTIIFDEIDTGVSGKIAEQMAQMMAQMGRQNRQVISITHLPQIAALGTAHYKVYKDETPQGTVSHMVRLSAEERVNEVAQMLSGSQVTQAALQHAREMLQG